MLSVSMDFDVAKQAWRANKVHNGNGCFVYKEQPQQEIKKTHTYNLRPRKQKIISFRYKHDQSKLGICLGIESYC